MGVIAVAFSTLRVVWSRFRAATADDGDPPLVRGEATEDGEEEDGDEDRRFRNSASFAARA